MQPHKDDPERATPVTGWVIAGAFDRRDEAERGINELVRGGVARGRISVVARDAVYERAIPRGEVADGKLLPAEEAAHVAGLGHATEPDTGSILTAGPLGDWLQTLDRSAPEHSLGVALNRLGMAESDAASCADRVRSGSILVVAEADAANAEGTRHMLRQAGAVEVCSGARPT